MRTTLRKLSRLKNASKHLPLLKMNKLEKLYTLAVKRVKKRPVVSLGTAALALGAISGVVAWLRLKR